MDGRRTRGAWNTWGQPVAGAAAASGSGSRCRRSCGLLLRAVQAAAFAESTTIAAGHGMHGRGNTQYAAGQRERHELPLGRRRRPLSSSHVLCPPAAEFGWPSAPLPAHSGSPCTCRGTEHARLVRVPLCSPPSWPGSPAQHSAAFMHLTAQPRGLGAACTAAATACRKATRRRRHEQQRR